MNLANEVLLLIIIIVIIIIFRHFHEIVCVLNIFFTIAALTALFLCLKNDRGRGWRGRGRNPAGHHPPTERRRHAAAGRASDGDTAQDPEVQCALQLVVEPVVRSGSARTSGKYLYLFSCSLCFLDIRAEGCRMVGKILSLAEI